MKRKPYLLLTLSLLIFGFNASAQETPAVPRKIILVHITHGPENPTRAALGFLVARTAVEEGHRVNLFLAGDAVRLLQDSVLNSLTGIGT